MDTAYTFTAALYARWVAEPDRVVLRLLDADGAVDEVTAARLLSRVSDWARAIGPADAQSMLVGVSLYHGLDLYAAFLGAAWAGHTPTMIAPPSPRMEPAKYADALAALLDHLALDALVVGPRSEGFEAGATRLLHPDDVPVDRWPFEPKAVSRYSVALVQHSSGTTGLQKGVAFSHGAVLAHHARYAERLGLTDQDVIVSWLPLYHDMGFVACFLLPLLAGVPVVALSAFDWVRRPLSLLRAVSDHGGTLCWLPNFAYDFMAKARRGAEALEGVDLSGVRAWINCSEPVQAPSHAAFVEAFGAVGVRPDQLAACYAMAENVFAVTQTLSGPPATLTCDPAVFAEAGRVEPVAGEGLVLVSNGPPLASTHVRVRGADEVDLPEGHVGELEILSSHGFDGYFRRPDLTVRAKTLDQWFRTGDLGFIWAGEIYVTGRSKDLIIVQGKTLYPTDAERAAGAVPGVNPGRVVAFGLPDARLGTEQLAIVAEAAADFDGPAPRLALAIRRHVAQTLDLTPGVVRVVPSRWLVKSTSGKLARGDNRAKYLREFTA